MAFKYRNDRALNYLGISNKKWLMHFTFFILIILLVIFLRWSFFGDNKNGEKCFKRDCHRKDAICDNLLSDLVDGSGTKPKPGNSIFFIESSCNVHGIVKLTARQACAIESAAVTNPDRDIFGIFPSPVAYMTETKNPIIEALLSYSNIHLRNVDLFTLGEHPNKDQWINTGQLFKSDFLIVHTSDYLRLLLLHKYGGIYLDLDTIVMKHFNESIPNFAGLENKNYICNSIMGFEPDGIGHEIVGLFIKRLQENYRPDIWGWNGPNAITHVIKQICQTDSFSEIIKRQCLGFHLYSSEEFFAINSDNIMFLFEKEHQKLAWKMIANSSVVHLWNHFSKDWQVKVGDPVVYGLLAAKFCPKVYYSSGEYF